ncbi:hypothetical protein LCGC14_0497680 [marine sediment metagenome]|uniref:O-antigen ligase-related domain-containing protein n=1 Tax=marine sediment metagenome TaxID=412755 RepID=A0A0F9VDI5_9ZZZZ
MQSSLTPGKPMLTLQPTALLLGLGMAALYFTTYLGSMAALMFLVACGALVIWRPQLILIETRNAWLLWAVAGWCALSVFWSNAPGLTLRYAIQLGLTFAIAIAAASRLSVTATLRVVLVVTLIVGLASIGLGRVNGNGLWTGIFGSKNALSQSATVMVIAAAAVLIDRRGRGGWVWLAALNLTIGMILLNKAGSAGGTIATMLAVLGMLSLWTMRRLTSWQRIFLGFLMVLGTIFVIMLVIGYFDAFAQVFLAATGKEITLTGRTDLWRIAFSEIARHPFLGQGFQAFWVPGNALAESLWAEFGITTKTGFHFHHTLISNAVEIGLIGVMLQIVVFFSTLVIILRWALAAPCAESIFLAGFMMRQFILMNSEVVFFTQFDTVSMLMAMTAVFAIRARREALVPAKRRAMTRAPVPGNRPAWQTSNQRVH